MSFTRARAVISRSLKSLPSYAPQVHRAFTTTRPRLSSETPPSPSPSSPSPSSPPQQSVSPLAPIGVAAALDPTITPMPKIFDEFSLRDRVCIVSGAGRGLGLEMALALCEAGARAVYCFDLPGEPSGEWEMVREYVRRMGVGMGGGEGKGKGGRLEYVCADVRDQEGMWRKVGEVGDREGRMDVCVAAAGVGLAHVDCLVYPKEQFEAVMNVNTNGVLYTAQAAGQQMVRFGNAGSIILIASMFGKHPNKDHAWVPYNTSKSAVIQMARSMACELGTRNIRVNSLSPGHIYTQMTAAYLDMQPHLLEKWSSLNPMGRIGRSDELRGVIAWLASDASSFCTGSDILVSGGHHAW
ncbi:Sorbose reductase SOU1 [Hypsizygus marmoreus]|uniref:Sorbose reductase SOU1 n=1 Tax=Hypsizygus marmoreus TaxID=39966 RepID=A0A369JP22_HYPMA|nr:Sorbose reductase SOU1 [Hypsizygus marmoreus]